MERGQPGPGTGDLVVHRVSSGFLSGVGRLPEFRVRFGEPGFLDKDGLSGVT